MNLKKLAEMAKVQATLEEAELSSPINNNTDSDMGIYIPVEEDDVLEPEQIPDDGFNISDAGFQDSNNITSESLESLMARCFDEKAYNIELERLLPYHTPIFRDNGNISELKSSMARFGITDALLVKSAGNGEYEILSGNRRKRAAEELLWTKVPCRIADNEKLDEITEKQIIVECNHSRLAKLELLSEKIRVCAVLGIEGFYELGISKEEAETYSKLTSLEADFLDMLDNGRLSLDASEILIALSDKQRQQALAVMTQHPDYKITSINAAELAECKRFTADNIAKILKPKPPVNVAIDAEIISEYMRGKTPEEISEIVTAAVKFYFQ